MKERFPDSGDVTKLYQLGCGDVLPPKQRYEVVIDMRNLKNMDLEEALDQLGPKMECEGGQGEEKNRKQNTGSGRAGWLQARKPSWPKLWHTDAGPQGKAFTQGLTRSLQQSSLQRPREIVHP